MISGRTTLIAHLGYPTHAFKAPLIYNPWFEKNDIDAVVVPMGVRAEDYPTFLRSLFQLTNIRGALVTMPHKVTTIGLVDEITPTARDRRRGQRGAVARGRERCSAIMFDGEGFVRGVKRKGLDLEPAPAPWSSATAASVRRSRHRWPPPASALRAVRRAWPRRPTRSAGRTAAHYPDARGEHRVERSRAATTSSSTRRRSA